MSLLRSRLTMSQNVHRNLNPGGYIELFSSNHPVACDDGTLPEDSALVQWSRLLLDASRKMGVPMDCDQYHEQRLKDAGFVNIVRKDYVWPTNTWPRDPKMKELGMLQHFQYSLPYSTPYLAYDQQSLNGSTNTPHSQVCGAMNVLTADYRR